MKQVEIGTFVGVPCTVTDGAFDSERFVNFETIDGRVSGFTASSNVADIDGVTCIKARVLSVDEETLLVKVFGSFFSTNGLAQVSTGQALKMAA